MPVFAQDGYHYGYVARKMDKQDGPKTISQFGENEGAWYRCEGSDELIIVEDQLSALRASDYMNAVALMGTDMPDKVLNIIKQTPTYANIFLALDGDVLPLAIKLAQRLRQHFRVKVIKLKKDLKDLPEQELVDTLWQAGVEFYKE